MKKDRISVVTQTNGIELNNLKNLEDGQIGNLEFLGFERCSDDDSFFAVKTSPIELLIETTEYLASLGKGYSLCSKSERLLNVHYQEADYFEGLKQHASNYKDGKFNLTEYNEFKKSLQPLLSPERELRDHQYKAAYHLYLLGNGANFSVPGSGKTSVVLSVYEKLKSEGKVNSLFVVGPLSSFGPWRREFKATLNRNPEFKILAGGNQWDRKQNYYASSDTKAELYLTTFQTLLYDQDDVKVLFEQEGIEVLLVIDEAHYIKRIEGEWAKAVLNIGILAKHRCVLTGTPLPRSYQDSYNLFDFLWPHSNVIDDNSRIRIGHLENIKDNNSASELLNERIGPLFYRVRKKDLGLKKPVFNPPLVVSMNHYENLVYQAIVTRIEDYSKEEYASNIEFVSRLYRGRMIRLRQAASYTGLVRTAIDGYNEDLLGQDSSLRDIVLNYDDLEVPAKLQRLLAEVKRLNSQGLKVLIWTHFIGTLELIQKHLTENDLHCKVIYGETPVENESRNIAESREKIRDEFVDPTSGLDILVANPAACAESISLHTTCFHAIYYDLSYNCAQYLQSLDRIHRVGGSEDNIANYYFLQYASTVDQDIRQNLSVKSERMYQIVERDYEIYQLDLYDDSDVDEVTAYQRLFKKGGKDE